MNCPNCNGELRISSDKMHMICPHCDSVFPMNPEMHESAKCDSKSSSVNRTDLIFDVQINYLNEKTNTTWRLIYGLINHENTIDTYIEGIELVCKENTNLATTNTRKEIFRAAVLNAKNTLSSDETPLFFINKGVFSKGKIGILITDKSVINITKKAISKLSADCIDSITITPSPYSLNEWRLNDDMRFEFGGITQSINLTAITISLICTLAYECRQDGHKITIKNYEF